MSDKEVKYHHGTVWLEFVSNKELFNLCVNNTVTQFWVNDAVDNPTKTMWMSFTLQFYLFNRVEVKVLDFPIPNLRLKVKRKL